MRGEGRGGGAAVKRPVGMSAVVRAVEQVGEDVKVIKGVAEGQAAQAQAEMDMNMLAPSI